MLARSAFVCLMLINDFFDIVNVFMCHHSRTIYTDESTQTNQAASELRLQTFSNGSRVAGLG